MLLAAKVMARTDKVHLVLNRCARHLVAEEPLVHALRTSARGATVHETHSLEELDCVAVAIEQAGARTVVLAGGDGTYMAGVTALHRVFGDRMPILALAPGGTVSTTARNWGFHGPAVPYAQKLLGAIADGTSRDVTRPTLHVQDNRGGDRLGFIWGAGLVARFFDAYYAQDGAGYVGAARIVARIFLGSPFGGALARRVLTPVPCELTVDGVRQAASGYSLMASSVVRDLGLHMQVLYRAAEDPSRVHFVASALGAPRLGPQMPLVLAGRRLRGKDHVDALAREVTVTFPETDAYVLDGEVIACESVTISAGPTIRVALSAGSAS